MSDILLAAPEGSATDKLFRTRSPCGGPDKATLLSDLTAVAEALAGRRRSVLLLDASFEQGDLERTLRETAQSHPDCVRLVLSDTAGGLRIRGAHQILPEQDDWRYLASTVSTAQQVSAQLSANPHMAGLISKLEKLPSPPMLYFDLRQELESEQGDLVGLAQIIARDPALVAEALKIANSGFYALPRSVTDLPDAIRLLGSDTLLSLVLAAHVFSGMPPPGMRLDVLWKHSARVSSLARQIAAMQGANRNQQGACAVAGILHDIGLIVLLENSPSSYQQLWKACNGDEVRLAEMERTTYGMDHGELGATVLKLWALPDEIVEAVQISHRWEEPVDAPVAQAVMTAEWLINTSRGDASADEPPPAFLSSEDSGQLAAWKEVRDGLEREVA